MKHQTLFVLIVVGTLAMAVDKLVATQMGAAIQRPSQEPEEWRAPKRKARIKNPAPSTEESRALGRKLFETACFACHGLSGRGDGPAAPAMAVKPSDLTAESMWNQTDGAVYWKISAGRTPMPAFETLYSAEERWAIVDYLRTIAPRPEPVPLPGHLLDRVVEEYLLIQRALAAAGEEDDVADLSKVVGLTRSLAALDLVKPESLPKGKALEWKKSRADLQSGAKRLAKAKSLPGQRLAFSTLSADLAAALEVFGFGADEAATEYSCEHAFKGEGAVWIQVGKPVSNPYMGPKMLGCGTEKRTLGKVSPPPPEPSSAEKAFH